MGERLREEALAASEARRARRRGPCSTCRCWSGCSGRPWTTWGAPPRPGCAGWGRPACRARAASPAGPSWSASWPWPGPPSARRGSLGLKLATAAVGPLALGAIGLLGWRPAGGWPPWLWGGLLAAGFLAPDWDLARRLAARREALLDELPGVLELLALATTAGQGLEQALRLVAEWGQGAVARALRGALQEVALGGRPLGAALEAMAAREALPELEAVAARLRAVHEQGLPLAESLAAQADALRERQRLALEEAGGRATVRMLVPIAVLILPAVGVVLLFPAVVEIWALAG